MASKHRLIFLGTLLVGLLLFYLGVNTWMEQKTKENIPPPIVIKQPEQKTGDQIKEERNLQTPLQPHPQEKVVQKSQINRAESFKQQSEAQKISKKEQQNAGKVEKKDVEKKESQTASKRIARGETRTRPEENSQKLRTYVFQVGAFKNKSNALRMIRTAKSKGFNAKLVKKGEFYKVYIYTKAPSYKYAYKKVKRHFKEAFLVRN